VTPDRSHLEIIARQIRGKIVEISHRARTPHLGSSLSCVDILVGVYFGALHLDPARPDDPGRDRFVLSKGHAALALFATLAARGFFPPALLDTFAAPGSCLEEHPGPGCAPGVEAATGSLGHGLSLGLGLALAGRIQGRPYRVFTLLSDGELNEGSVWEAAMYASGQELDSLRVIVDFNKWQATGRSCEISGIRPLAGKWASFGFTVREGDGHDFDFLIPALTEPPDQKGSPLAVIAHTVKGKGISFMEDDNNWHYRIPTAQEVALAKQELELP
jgi:transketolase